jgi:hypothetical protein
MGTEGGDLASMMGTEDGVESYDSFLEAIEEGREKLKSADEIRAAFAASAFSHANWSDSAWYEPEDALEQSGELYVEPDLEFDEEEQAAEPVEISLGAFGVDDLF